MLWLKRLMDEIDFKQDRYFVHYDSESIIYMNKNLIFYSSKHIDVRYHYVRDVLDVQSLELAKIHTDKNVSDMVTKVVTKDKHVFYCDGVGKDALSYVDQLLHGVGMGGFVECSLLT